MQSTETSQRPQTITTREQLEATHFEVGVIYLDNGKFGRCEVKRIPNGWLRRFVNEGYPSPWLTIRDAPHAEELARYLPLTYVSGPEPVAAPVDIEALRENLSWLAFVEDKEQATAIAELFQALSAVTAERDRARENLRHAPHEYECSFEVGSSENLPCDCWKAGLA